MDLALANAKCIAERSSPVNSLRIVSMGPTHYMAHHMAHHMAHRKALVLTTALWKQVLGL